MQFSKTSGKTHVLIIALFVLPVIPMAANALPAFPGAMGFGSTTVGGRSVSMKIYKVNTLADNSNGSCSGDICTGSLRYALTASGPRIVIFTVGGTILLSTPISIHNPYLTVAGQTAPGGGILIKGPGWCEHCPNPPNSYGNGSIVINTHDVIIRGLRIRDTGKAAIEILGESGTDYNIIIDHNSMSWSDDTITGMAYTNNNVTYSWNIISEGSNGTTGHGSLMLISSSGGCPINTSNVSIHHNMFAHSGNIDRSPLLKQDTTSSEVINNLVYNWYWEGTWTMGRAYIAKNHFIRGANTLGTSSTCNSIRVASEGECPQLPMSSVMVSHNIGPCRTSDTGDDWLIVDGGTSPHRTNSPPFTLSGITEDNVTNVKSLVLAGAGATQPSRDSVDVRIVNNVNNLTGTFINDPSDVGGWPTIASGSYPTDTDGDGIPDTWETARGLNPNDPSDWNKDRDGDGYLNIEEYINSFFPAPFARIPNSPSIIGIK